jgi:uncharacterized protein (TIGR02145 family)
MKLELKLLTVIPAFFIAFSSISGQSVKDTDGNIYGTVDIGKQVWMAENLKTTKYNDGTSIPLISDNKVWSKLKTGAYCWFNNEEENKEEFGALYNWYAVDSKKLCPVGWHVPSELEIESLITFLGDQNIAGNKLKITGSEHWMTSLTIVTNDFQFSALPGGFRLYSGSFSEPRQYAVWWTSTGYQSTQAWNMGLYFNSSKLFNGHDIAQAGFSVRCIKNK